MSSVVTAAGAARTAHARGLRGGVAVALIGLGLALNAAWIGALAWLTFGLLLG